MKTKFLPIALALLLAPAVFAQDYEIKLTRPKKAGAEYNLDVAGKQSKDVTVTSDGAVERAAPIMPHPSGLRLTRLPVRPPMRPQLAAVVGVAARRI